MGSALRFRRTLAIFASNTVEELHLREALTALPPPQRAMVRSQGGPLSSKPFVCCPTSRLTKFSSSLSMCCSSVLSTCPSPCLPVTAGVAVHSTALATTGQVARSQGCWGGVGSLWRAPSDRSTTSMVVVWRSWQMGCHCLVEPSWPLTPLWPSGPHTDARKGHTLNLRVQGDVLGWSSLPARLADVGRPRQRILVGWQLRRLGTFPVFCPSVEVAWFHRWSNILSCAAARAFADSAAGGAGGDVPSSHDVVRDNRF